MCEQVTILGTNVHSVSQQEALEIIAEFIASGKPHHIITANAEIVYQAYHDQTRRQIINNADLVTADGAGVVWAANYLGQPLPERVTGIDLFHAICRIAGEKQWKIYILGAKQEIIEQAVQNLQTQYPHCSIVGYHNGYFDQQEEEAILNDIKKKQPDVLLVAMGVPKQDDWIITHQKILQVPVAMGVGGCLDVISGKLKRAPQWMQKMSLEWLYRLLLQPSRIGRMMALPKFMLAVHQMRKKK